MPKKYRFNDEKFKLRKEFFGGLVYEASSGRMLELNKSGFVVLEACRTPKSKKEITIKLNKFFEFNKENDKILDEIDKFLQYCVEKNILKIIIN
jgi:mevalonate kinase